MGELEFILYVVVKIFAFVHSLLEELRVGNKNVTIKAYPNLNHLFQTCEKGTLAEYGQLEETINPEVLKDMTEWIKKQQ